jgi:outer membrane lipoprotein-sorting protein
MTVSDQSRPSEDEMETPFELELRGLFHRTAPQRGRVDVNALASSMRPKQMRRFPMVLKVASAALVAASVIASIMILHPRATNAAFADVQQKLKEVRTVKFTITRSTPNFPNEVDRVMYLGSDLARAELSTGEIIVLNRKEKKMLRMQPKAKKVTVFDLPEYSDPIPNQIERLQSVSDHQLKQLPDREIDGKRAQEFEIEEAGRKESWWIDSKSHLPIRMESRFKRPVMVGPKVKAPEIADVLEVFSDFQYNVALPDKLFLTKLPDGYAVEIKRMQTREEIKRAIDEQIQQVDKMVRQQRQALEQRKKKKSQD